MQTILSEIVEKIRLDQQKEFENDDSNSPAPFRKNPPIPILESIHKNFFLICEIKKASPSKGLIRENYNPVDLAKEYTRGGASALSILTEKNYFQGNSEHLKSAREVTSLPILRKDFIFHPKQIREAYEWGADFVLLIAEILTNEEIISLQNEIKKWGMTALVEVHHEAELDRVLEVHPQILGINNRDLKTFKVDKNTAIRLKKKIPEGIPVIAESGIEKFADIQQLIQNGFSGALVGESLLRQKDVFRAVQALLGKI